MTGRAEHEPTDEAGDAAFAADLRIIEEYTGVGPPERPRPVHQHERPPLRSGAIRLDRMLGGGYPAGATIELAGPPESGKSALALAAIAGAQRRGLTCGLMDAEGIVTEALAKAHGADPEALIVLRPDTLEAGLGMLSGLAPAVDLLALDTLDGLATLRERDTTLAADDSTEVRDRATLIARGLAELDQPRRRATLLIITHARRSLWTTGGSGLARHAALRLQLRLTRDRRVKQARVAKGGHLARFGQTAAFSVHGGGVDAARDLGDCAVELGLILHGERAELHELLRQSPTERERWTERCLRGPGPGGVIPRIAAQKPTPNA